MATAWAALWVGLGVLMLRLGVPLGYMLLAVLLLAVRVMHRRIASAPINSRGGCCADNGLLACLLLLPPATEGSPNVVMQLLVSCHRIARGVRVQRPPQPQRGDLRLQRRDPFVRLAEVCGLLVHHSFAG